MLRRTEGRLAPFLQSPLLYFVRVERADAEVEPERAADGFVEAPAVDLPLGEQLQLLPVALGVLLGGRLDGRSAVDRLRHAVHAAPVGDYRAGRAILPAEDVVQVGAVARPLASILVVAVHERPRIGFPYGDLERAYVYLAGRAVGALDVDNRAVNLLVVEAVVLHAGRNVDGLQAQYPGSGDLARKPSPAVASAAGRGSGLSECAPG